MSAELKDAAGQRWLVSRRASPWRRKIQPLAMAVFLYNRYAVEEKQRPPSTRERAKARRAASRERQKEKREQASFGGWQWLLLPLLVIAGAALAVVLQIVELVMLLVHLSIFVVLLPLALIELLAQGIAGAVLVTARAIGLARSRVDVAGYHGTGRRLASLTVIYLSGWENAGQLVDALADRQRRLSAPFNPYADPTVHGLLARQGAEVAQHESVWPGVRT